MITFTDHPTDSRIRLIRLNGRQVGYLLDSGHCSLIRRVGGDVISMIGQAVGSKFKGCCMPPDLEGVIEDDSEGDS